MGHGDTNVGSKFDNSVYWNFIDRDLYQSKGFTDSLKIGILLLNVYHFFVKQNCLWQCLYNVFNTDRAVIGKGPNGNSMLVQILRLNLDSSSKYI